MVLTMLDSDSLLCVAELMDPRTLGRFARVCVAAAFAARAIMFGCKFHGVSPILNQGEMCTTFAISPYEAQQLPFTKKVQLGLQFRLVTHIFDLAVALPRLLALLGGWKKLKARLDIVEMKQRKRDNLTARRKRALEKRRAMLDGWFAQSLPFGDEIDSVMKWSVSLHQRGAQTEPLPSQKITRWLSPKHLKGHKFADVTNAVVRYENKVQEYVRREMNYVAEAAVRKTAIVAELERRGYAYDDTLHIIQHFDKPTPNWVFAARTAKWMWGGHKFYGVSDERRFYYVQNSVAQIVCEIKQRERDAQLEAARRASERAFRANQAAKARKRAREAAARSIRRKNLQSALRRRRMLRATAPQVYDDFIFKRGSDDDVEEVVALMEKAAMQTEAARASQLTDALAAVGAKRPRTWGGACQEFERRGTLRGEPATAAEVAAAVKEKDVEKG